MQQLYRWWFPVWVRSFRPQPTFRTVCVFWRTIRHLKTIGSNQARFLFGRTFSFGRVQISHDFKANIGRKGRFEIVSLVPQRVDVVNLTTGVHNKMQRRFGIAWRFVRGAILGSLTWIIKRLDKKSIRGYNYMFLMDEASFSLQSQLSTDGARDVSAGREWRMSS